MRNEKGLTFVEMLATVVVILVVISISGYSTSCMLKNSDFYDKKNEARAVYQEIEKYYYDWNVMPLGSYIDDLESKVKTDVKKFIPEIDTLLEKHKVYEIDVDKLFLNNGLTKDAVKNYYVVYVSEEDIRNDSSLKGLDKYNGSIIRVYAVELCSGEVHDLVMGKKRYTKVSESLKYEISQDYVDCPNESLCKKIEK